MRKILTLTLFILTVVICNAQRERNYIYLMDCTKSMEGYNGASDIWAPTKSFLKKSIESDPAGSTVTVVPFQGAPHEAISFMRGDFDWKDIEKPLDKYIENVTNTNIYDAWLAGEGMIDKDRDNYLILLTDGEDTDPQRRAKFKDLIGRFCGKYKNVHAFYVQLTPKAVIDSELRRLIDMCTQLHVVSVNGEIMPFGAFATNTLSVNTLSLPVRIAVPFSDFGTFKASVVCDDPHIKVTLVDGKISGGKALFDIKSCYGDDKAAIYNAIGEPEYTMSFTVKSPDCFIVNDRMTVDVTNKEERMLTLGGIDDEEIYIGKSEYYPAFMFCDEYGPDTLSLCMSPEANGEAVRDGAAAVMQVTSREGIDSYKVLVDGKEAPDGKFTLSAEAPVSDISVVFLPSTPGGTYHFDLKMPEYRNIDRINNIAAEDFAPSLRARYAPSMNPLLKALIWTGVVLVILLVLWFAVFRSIFFPTVSRISYLTVDKPYYGHYRIRGARKVILSSVPVRQSAINRLFTGKVINKVNETWKTPAVFLPNKKGLKLASERGAYVVNPYTSRMERYNSYAIKSKEGVEYEISLN